MIATLVARRALIPFVAVIVVACGPDGCHWTRRRSGSAAKRRRLEWSGRRVHGLRREYRRRARIDAAARASTPAAFTLVGEGQPVTPFVARTSRCDGLAVDSHKAKAGEVVQLGVVIVPPDGTGDINIYTLWYFTSDAKLAHHLQRTGVDAQHVPTLDYDYVAGGSALGVRVRQPGHPQLSITGNVSESTNPAGSFTANWWAWSDGRRVKMSTHVPLIFIGSADLVLSTAPNGALGTLLGGGTAGFPILQQFNTFPSAHLAAAAF